MQPPSPCLCTSLRLHVDALQVSGNHVPAIKRKIDASTSTHRVIELVGLSIETLQIPELPESMRPGPDAEPETVPKWRYQPPRPDEHFYAARRRACERMGLLEKDHR